MKFNRRIIKTKALAGSKSSLAVKTTGVLNAKIILSLPKDGAKLLFNRGRRATRLYNKRPELNYIFTLVTKKIRFPNFILSKPHLIRQVFLQGHLLFIRIRTSCNRFFIFISKEIYLPNLTIKQGQLLIIDTDNMTITLDGVNIMKYLHNNSVFFLFSPGENIININNANHKSNILWRDAWV